MNSLKIILYWIYLLVQIEGFCRKLKSKWLDRSKRRQYYIRCIRQNYFYLKEEKKKIKFSNVTQGKSWLNRSPKIIIKSTKEYKENKRNWKKKKKISASSNCISKQNKEDALALTLWIFFSSFYLILNFFVRFSLFLCTMFWLIQSQCTSSKLYKKKKTVQQFDTRQQMKRNTKKTHYVHLSIVKLFEFSLYLKF